MAVARPLAVKGSDPFRERSLPGYDAWLLTRAGRGGARCRVATYLDEIFDVELCGDGAIPDHSVATLESAWEPFARDLGRLPLAARIVIASPLVRRIAVIPGHRSRQGPVLGTYLPDHAEAGFAAELWTGRVGPILGVRAARHTLVHECLGHGLSAAAGLPITGAWLPYLARTHLPDPLTSPYLADWLAAMLEPGGGPDRVARLFTQRLSTAAPGLIGADRVTGSTLVEFEAAVAGAPRYAGRAALPAGLGLFASNLVGEALGQPRRLPAHTLFPDARALATLEAAVRRYRAAWEPSPRRGGPGGTGAVGWAGWSVDRRIDHRLARAASRYRAADLRRALDRLEPVPSAYATVTPIEALPEHLTVAVAVPQLRPWFPDTLALCGGWMRPALRRLAATRAHGGRTLPDPLWEPLGTRREQRPRTRSGPGSADALVVLRRGGDAGGVELHAQAGPGGDRKRPAGLELERLGEDVGLEVAVARRGVPGQCEVRKRC